MMNLLSKLIKVLAAAVVAVLAALALELVTLEFFVSLRTPGLLLASQLASPATEHDVLGNRWPLGLLIDSVLVFVILTSIYAIRKRLRGRGGSRI